MDRSIVALTEFRLRNNASTPTAIHNTVRQGHTFTLRADPSDTIADIKERLCTSQGLPVQAQRLLYRNTELSDEFKSLEDCGIRSGANLNLVLNLVSGTAQQLRQLPKPETPAGFYLLFLKSDDDDIYLELRNGTGTGRRTPVRHRINIAGIGAGTEVAGGKRSAGSRGDTGGLVRMGPSGELELLHAASVDSGESTPRMRSAGRADVDGDGDRDRTGSTPGTATSEDSSDIQQHPSRIRPLSSDSLSSSTSTSTTSASTTSVSLTSSSLSLSVSSSVPHSASSAPSCIRRSLATTAASSSPPFARPPSSAATSRTTRTAASSPLPYLSCAASGDDLSLSAVMGIQRHGLKSHNGAGCDSMVATVARSGKKVLPCERELEFEFQSAAVPIADTHGGGIVPPTIRRTQRLRPATTIGLKRVTRCVGDVGIIIPDTRPASAETAGARRAGSELDSARLAEVVAEAERALEEAERAMEGLAQRVADMVVGVDQNGQTMEFGFGSRSEPGSANLTLERPANPSPPTTAGSAGGLKLSSTSTSASTSTSDLDSPQSYPSLPTTPGPHSMHNFTVPFVEQEGCPPRSPVVADVVFLGPVDETRRSGNSPTVVAAIRVKSKPKPKRNGTGYGGSASPPTPASSKSSSALGRTVGRKPSSLSRVVKQANPVPPPATHCARFCGPHRMPETHGCVGYREGYRKEGREKLGKELVMVKAEKVGKEFLVYGVHFATFLTSWDHVFMSDGPT
ncbi:hypothetical protein HDU93_004682 [Gonapodya sp. JEL0774]|nr:hypothetical protein HDU93_004682 [Gonapodya sp. JEL0774]